MTKLILSLMLMMIPATTFAELTLVDETNQVLTASVVGRVDFGSVEVYRTRSTTLTLINNGPHPLTNLYIYTQGMDFSSVDFCPNTLRARERCQIRVTFRPRSRGLQTGRLVISSREERLYVGLRGWGERAR